MESSFKRVLARSGYAVSVVNEDGIVSGGFGGITGNDNPGQTVANLHDCNDKCIGGTNKNECHNRICPDSKNTRCMNGTCVEHKIPVNMRKGSINYTS